MGSASFSKDYAQMSVKSHSLRVIRGNVFLVRTLGPEILSWHVRRWEGHYGRGI